MIFTLFTPLNIRFILAFGSGWLFTASFHLLYFAFAAVLRYCCCCCIHSFILLLLLLLFFTNSICCPLTTMPVFRVNMLHITTTSTHYFEKIMARKAPTQRFSISSHFFLSSSLSVCMHAWSRCLLCFELYKMVLLYMFLFVEFLSFTISVDHIRLHWNIVYRAVEISLYSLLMTTFFVQIALVHPNLLESSELTALVLFIIQTVLLDFAAFIIRRNGIYTWSLLKR